MLRRLAISLTATSALVLTATAPALADHGGPEPFATIDAEMVKGGNVQDCEHLGEIDPESYKSALDTHAGWNYDGDNTATPPNEVNNGEGHAWWDVSFEAEDDRENAFLNVINVTEGKTLLVIVKGSNATNVFINEPGEDMLGLYGPALDGGKHPTISHYSVCKIDQAPPKPEPEPEPEDEGKGGGESTPTPTPSKTPAPVPTAVPAGLADGEGGSVAPVGIAAAALMVLAGAAALVGRKLAQQR